MPDDEHDLEEDWADIRPKPGPKFYLGEAILIDPDKLPNETVSEGGVIISEPINIELQRTAPVGLSEVGEVTVLPADSPREPLGWTFRELTDEDFAERDSPENLRRLAENREAMSPQVRAFETNHAAPFPPEPPVGHEGMYAWPPSQGSMVLTVLPELTGRPWNNAAANYLLCLRPSAVRVTHGTVTLDSYSWRVTVYLNEDNTIRLIEQEVNVGLTGFRNGWDAGNYLAGNHEALGRPQPTGFINPRAVRRLQLYSTETIPARDLVIGDTVVLEGERFIVEMVEQYFSVRRTHWSFVGSPEIHVRDPDDLLEVFRGE
jgi:hypothetical protein